MSGTRTGEGDGRDAALRARNRRTGLILAAIALICFVGVILKYALARY